MRFQKQATEQAKANERKMNKEKRTARESTVHRIWYLTRAGMHM